ncbi:Na(+)-translocating NADH-quinone reductase subunit C [Pannonibacter sp. Q-1]
MSDQRETLTAKTQKGPIGRFLALPADSTPKTIFVAVVLCLVASMVVSLAAVSLRPLQQQNALRNQQINILQVAGLYEPGQDVAKAFAVFEPGVLELETGRLTDKFDPATFDNRAAAKDPELSVALTDDPASIVRQARFVSVYILRDANGAVDKVILPIHGYGLWSTLYGYVAIEADGSTIYGLQFYQHAETPGLGGEVDNPRWRAQWSGKSIYNDAGDVAITISRMAPPRGQEHHIDAISGATLTGRGVENLVRFWMGDRGYAPFLANVRAGEI